MEARCASRASRTSATRWPSPSCWPICAWRRERSRLASRLGIYRFKSELEDLAFKYLDPDQYREIHDKLSAVEEERAEFLRRVITILQERLTESGIRATITGREKHLYSIYHKMIAKD